MHLTFACVSLRRLIVLNKDLLELGYLLFMVLTKQQLLRLSYNGQLAYCCCEPCVKGTIQSII